MYTNLINKDNYLDKVNKILNESQNIIKSKSISYKNIITKKSLTAFRQIQKTNGLKRMVQNMLLESAWKSEKEAANSADLNLLLSTELTKQVIKSNIKTNKIILELYEDLENVRKTLENQKKQLVSSDLVIAIRSAVTNKKIASMIIEAINLAGLDGRIFINGNNSKYSVELVKGYVFDVATYPEFYNEHGKWEQENVKVLIVDGVIESESEIHVLLTEIVDKKTPLMIVSRGYGEEVIATLAANKARGIIKVLPIRIPFELESVNIIADMAIVSGADIITPLKGDIISSARLQKLAEVEKVESIAKGITTIINNKTIHSVKLHADSLQKRRDEQKIDEISEILNKRIRSLFSHCVHIKLGSKTEQERNIEIEELDYGLRTTKSILSHGAAKIENILPIIKNNVKNKLFCNAINTWSDLHKDVRPLLSIYSALYHAISITATLSSIDKAILLDSVTL